MSKPYFMKTNRSTATSWLQCEGEQHQKVIPIQLTVSPCPIMGRYQDRDVEQQIEIVKVVLYKTFCKYPKYKLVDTSFEFNSKGNIHSHSLVHIPVSMAPHFACIQIGKYVHSICGRKGVPWYVAGFTDTMSSVEKWVEYINKEPVEKYDGKVPKSLSKTTTFFAKYEVTDEVLSKITSKK